MPAVLTDGLVERPGTDIDARSTGRGPADKSLLLDMVTHDTARADTARAAPVTNGDRNL